MRGDVDLIVLAAGTPRVALVAQIKLHVLDVLKAAVEAQLKRYMLASRCPVGLIVSPETTFVMVDQFESFTEASVQEGGEFNTRDFLGLDHPVASERELRAALTRWLEQLTSGWPAVLPSSPDARTALLQQVVPAVTEGRVTSASME